MMKGSVKFLFLIFKFLLNPPQGYTWSYSNNST